MKIAQLEFRHGIFLAPLAGITDSIFRRLCKNEGAELVFTEMASAKALYYGDVKTMKLITAAADERPVAVQIFGSEPEMIGYAARQISAMENVDIIDINMGCPVPKIVKSGEGAALIKDLRLSEKIIKQAVANSGKPVTVKTRTGWEDENEIYDFALMAQDCGISAITVHGRTKAQMYSGSANWDIIGRVSSMLRVPVIGSGDITSGSKAVEFLRYTGAAGLMAARGALGNPWIFREMICLLDGKEYLRPDNTEICDVILKHLEGSVALYGAHAGLVQMRKHIAWYVKGMAGSAEFRKRIFSITDYDELEAAVRGYLEN